MRTLQIKELAYGIAGDKGNTNDITLTPYHGADYDLLLESVTVDRVEAVYGTSIDGPVERYELPGPKAIKYILHGSRHDGVSSSLNLDIHGKSMAEPLLDAEITVPESYDPPPVVDGEKTWRR